MLRIQRLPAILDSILHDGVNGAVLMNVDGSILCSKFLPGSTVTETMLAAITSNMWASVTSANPDATFHLIKLEEGIVGVTWAGNGYLVSAYGTNVGMLRGRLLSLSTYFSRVFEQLSRKS
jgi:hypothetical protein